MSNRHDGPGGGRAACFFFLEDAPEPHPEPTYPRTARIIHMLTLVPRTNERERVQTLRTKLATYLRSERPQCESRSIYILYLLPPPPSRRLFKSSPILNAPPTRQRKPGRTCCPRDPECHSTCQMHMCWEVRKTVHVSPAWRCMRRLRYAHERNVDGEMEGGAGRGE